MKHFFKHAHHTFWMTLLVVLMIAALLLTGVRLAAPLLEKNYPVFEKWASNLLGQPLHIDHLKVGWSGLNPVLELRGVTVLDKATAVPVLKIGELDIAVKLLHSVFNGKMQLERIRVSDLDLTAKQELDGHFSLLGVTSSAGSTTSIFDGFVNWLLMQPQLSVDHLKLHWYDQNGQLQPLIHLQITLQNQPRRHLIAGRAQLDQTTPSSSDFFINMTGNWQKKSDIKAHVYLKAKSILLAQWLSQRDLGGFLIKKGNVDFQLWGLWQDQQWQSWQSLMNFNNLQLQKNKNIVPSTQHAGTVTEDVWRWQGSANLLWKLQPASSWQLSANLNNVSFSRWHGVPGVSHLNGYLQIEPEKGLLLINNRYSAIDFGDLFLDSLALKGLEMQINWTQQSDGWLVQVPRFVAATEDVRVQGQSGLWIPQYPSHLNFQLCSPSRSRSSHTSMYAPADSREWRLAENPTAVGIYSSHAVGKDSKSPVISLLATAQAKSAKNLPNYLPIGIMAPALVHWLDTSIKHIDNGQSTVVLQGALQDFPFDNGSGTFLIDSYIENGELAYWPDWPSIKKLTGELIFRGRQMEFRANGGEIANTPIAGTYVAIPMLAKNVVPILQVKSQMQGDLANGLVFLQKSPLQDKVLGKMQDMQIKGPMQLNLQLAIPLEPSNIPLKVKGQIKTNKATFLFPSHNIAINQLSGLIDFTEEGAKAKNLSGTFKNKPIKLSFSSDPFKVYANYADMQITLEPKPESWLVGLRNNEMAGEVTIPQDKTQTYQANFAYLYLKSEQHSELDLKPSEVPRLIFKCEDLHYGDKNLGNLHLQLIPEARGVNMWLHDRGTAFTVMAKGLWTEKQSTLAGVFTSNNVAAALASLGSSAKVNAKAAQLNFALDWDGAPYDVALARLRGKLTLRMQQGAISDLSASTQRKMDIGRLLNLLNFQTLQRRLKLDFSDLTDKGFSFDKVRGELTIRNGNLYVGSVVIEGPVAFVVLSGRMGLVDEDYDINLKITPHLTSALPFLVGIAGGPIAGAAAWLADKVLTMPVNKIMTDTYRITGSWENPSIVQVGGVATGKF